jgi:hypothetical protein
MGRTAWPPGEEKIAMIRPAAVRAPVAAHHHREVGSLPWNGGEDSDDGRWVPRRTPEAAEPTHGPLLPTAGGATGRPFRTAQRR